MKNRASQLGLRTLAALGVLAGSVALAQSDVPAEAQARQTAGLDVTEHPAVQVPLGLKFNDEQGNPVQLNDYFKTGKPVILTLNYYGCPGLCSLQLNGLLEGLKELEWTAGNEFDIVTVSFDPSEDSKLARRKRESYIEEYNRATTGWRFLTGTKGASQELADTVGYKFRWDDASKLYVHPAVIMVLTPDGKVSRYLYGVKFDPRTLRMALTEASQGRIGTTFERFVMFCYHYDPSSGKYSLAASRLMTLGGGLTAVLLGGYLSVLWLHERRRKARVVKTKD